MRNAIYNIEFKASGRGKAQCPSNPKYPEGKNMRNPSGFGCIVELPYPAPECGAFIVRCSTCQASGAITAAGRPDDPKSFQMMCHVQGATH